MNDSVIQMKDIVKTYYQGTENELTVLHDVSMEVKYGEFISVVGASGSGKSTLMNIIGLLDRPTSGSYFLAGTDTSLSTDKEMSKFRNRSIGFVFQNYNLIPRSDCIQNVELPMLYAGVKPAERKERAIQLLEIVGMKDRMDHKPDELSGGQKQRVAIAGVMAMRPQCIILDEPTAMLDPNGRKDVIRTVHELNKKEGITVLLITHYMEEAIDADRVIVMDDGKVIMDGVPKEIFSRVKELKEHGLDVPQATELAYELKEAGMPLTEGILSREELADQLMTLLADEN